MARAWLAFAAMLALRYLVPTSLVYLHHERSMLQMYLRLVVLLLTQRLSRTDAVTWGLLLVGVTLVTVLSLAAWDLTTWERGAFSVNAPAL
jgi:hypothetical protein